MFLVLLQHCRRRNLLYCLLISGIVVITVVGATSWVYDFWCCSSHRGLARGWLAATRGHESSQLNLCICATGAFVQNDVLHAVVGGVVVIATSCCVRSFLALSLVLWLAQPLAVYAEF